MPKVGWLLLYGFCSKFHTLSGSGKNFENLLRVDKVTESLKVGTFLRNSVVCVKWDIKPYLHTHLYHP